MVEIEISDNLMAIFNMWCDEQWMRWEPMKNWFVFDARDERMRRWWEDESIENELTKHFVHCMLNKDN